MVPESFSVAQNATVGNSKKVQQQQKMGGGRGGGLQRSNSYASALKPIPFSMTPSSRSSFGGHSSTPSMPDAPEDSIFQSETGPDVSAIGPGPVLSELIQY